MTKLENMIKDIPQNLTKIIFNTFIRNYLQKIEENLNMLSTVPFVFIIVNTVVDNSVMMDDFARDFHNENDFCEHERDSYCMEEYHTVLSNILDNIQETKPDIEPISVYNETINTHLKEKITEKYGKKKVVDSPDHVKDLWITCHKIKHVLDTFTHKVSKNKIKDFGDVVKTIETIKHLMSSYSEKQHKLINQNLQ